MLLQVYYLDNLQCDAVLGLPQILPRSHVFNTDVIDDIIKSDKKVFNEGHVSYGKLLVSGYLLQLFYLYFCTFTSLISFTFF
jgi:hypothetical protein